MSLPVLLHLQESRKRKMPGSVVTAVPQPPEEPEEEYDPTKPMIGRVASTVKVGERRSVIGKALGATIVNIE